MADLIIKPSSSNDSLKFQRSDGTTAIDITGTTATLDSGMSFNGTLGSSAVVPASIGGGEVLLNTYTADNSSNIIAITGMTTTYNTYKFVVTGLRPATNSVHVYWFLKTEAGDVRITSYRSSHWQTYYNGSGSGYQNNNTSDSLFGIESDLSSGGEYNGVFYVFNPADSSKRTHGTGLINYQNADAYNKQISCGGHNEGFVEAHTRINLQTESGNWHSGTVRMYGIK